MSRVITSLDQISQQYAVFTKDQVLTEQQLNSVSTYLDDQQRITRTALSGIGIVQGLVVNWRNNQIELSQGLGITGDGDLFNLAKPLRYDRVKAYPEDGPEYLPFMKGEKKLPFFQLVEKDEKDELAKPFSSLEANGNLNVNKCLFVLFAESIIEDKDLCTGSDCDNGSRTYHSRMRLLCIDAEFSEHVSAKTVMPSPSDQEMDRLFVANVRFDASIDTQNEWFKQLRGSCEQSDKQMLPAFANFWKTYQRYLQDYVEGNPSANWASRLESVASKARAENSRLVYYYEFLHDLANTWNDLLDELEQARPSMLAQLGVNSKHLLLGGLEDVAPSATRTDFIASPIHARDALSPVLFYIEKLSNLLNGFGWTQISALKITPSAHTQPSVPGFYNNSIFNTWDYAAAKAHKNRYLLGYQSDQNRPLGGAESPLNRKQSSYDFYRIEGAIGKSFSTTSASIENMIKEHHLPISVTGVLIEGDFNKVLKPIYPFKKGLANFDYLLKKDLSYQLEDVTQFSRVFKDEVVSKSSKESLVVGDHMDLGEQVNMRDAEIKSDTQKAIALLQKPDLSATEKTNFTTSLNNVVKNAGLFKNDVAKVSSTHFPTKFDQIIVNQTWHWIDWLDILQKADEDDQKTKSQLPNFLNQYPGFEVSNGVVRGGTFVLIYNAGGTIIGTGMLSHYIPMPIIQAPIKPDLPKYELPLNAIPLPGIQIKPSFELEVDRKLTAFGHTFTQQVDNQLSNNTSYLNAFRDSIAIVKDFNLSTRGEITGKVFGEDMVNVAAIDGALSGLVVSGREITSLDTQILNASTAKEKQVYIDRKAKKQEQMAEDIYYVASYTESSKEIDSVTTGKIVKALSTSGLSIADNSKAVGRVKTFMNERENSAFAIKLKASMGAKFAP